MNTDNTFQILSLDGGGIRGLFSAAVLASLEDDLGISIMDHFDLITGTSTGGIIAIALGMGLSPREIVEFYVTQGSAIFPDSWPRRKRHWIKHKYDQPPLIRALKGALKDRRLGDSMKRLVIPTYNHGRDDVRVFKTAHHTRLTRDWKIPAWQIALATSAAPTYFPACREIEAARLIDGGVWANNPTMIGIVEAMSLLNVPLDAIHVFSLGTCDDLTHPSDRLDRGGKMRWANNAVRVTMRGQSLGTNTMAKLLLGEDHVLRLDPQVPAGLYALDKLSGDKLIAEAAHASQHFSPEFAKRFRGHRAPVFTPYNGTTEPKS